MKRVRSIRIDDGLWRYLQSIAYRKGIKVSMLINLALNDYVKKDFEKESERLRKKAIRS